MSAILQVPFINVHRRETLFETCFEVWLGAWKTKHVTRKVCALKRRSVSRSCLEDCADTLDSLREAWQLRRIGSEAAAQLRVIVSISQACVGMASVVKSE